MFSSYLADTQTDRQTDKQTKSGKNITSLAEVIKCSRPVNQTSLIRNSAKTRTKKNCERNYYVKHTSLLIVCHEHKRSKTHKHKHSTLHEIPNFRRNEI